MRVLHGLQGEGNRHITRARAIASHLINASIELDDLFSGRARKNYFDIANFGAGHCDQGLTRSPPVGARHQS